jgi:arginine/lysine/histidine transporter system substrate-binding protein
MHFAFAAPMGALGPGLILKRVLRRDDLKATRVLPTVLVILMVILGATLPGCSVFSSTTTSAAESTTTTVAGQQTPADVAIAAVSKSATIATPQVIKAGTLLAGSDAAFPPLEFAKKGGGYQGFDVDLCAAIAKKLGLQLEIVPTIYRDLVSGLIDDNTYDLIMAGLVITPEFQAQYSFTDAYLPAVLAITTPSGSPLTDAAALSGKMVGVQKGTMAATEMAKLPGVQLKQYDRILDAFDDMLNGQLNAVVIERLVSDYILKNYEDYTTKLANTGSVDLSTGYGYGVKKENTALLSAVDAAIAELRTDGVYKLICEKWGVTGN